MNEWDGEEDCRTQIACRENEQIVFLLIPQQVSSLAILCQTFCACTSNEHTEYSRFAADANPKKEGPNGINFEPR